MIIMQEILKIIISHSKGKLAGHLTQVKASHPQNLETFGFHIICKLLWYIKVPYIGIIIRNLFNRD